MSKKPTDPLTTTKEYTYSKLFYWNAYQIKSDWEGESVAYEGLDNNKDSVIARNEWNEWRGNPGQPSIFSYCTGKWIKGLFDLDCFAPLAMTEHLNFMNFTDFWLYGLPQAQAATGNPTLTYIKSNYNGMVVKTESGSTKYLIAVPSLFLNTGSWTVVLPVNTQTGFYIQWQTNSGWVLFAPQLVFSSGSLPSNDTERITFASWIANAYSWTILATNPGIAPFISALTSNNTGTLASLGGGVVSGSLGGSASSSTSGGGGSSTQCSPGSYSATGNTPCTTTTAGYYVGNTGATIQTQCAAGYYCNIGSTSATQNDCPANSWCALGSGSPTACGGSLVSPARSTSIAACALRGEQQYTTPGSFTWTVPVGVTSVSVVCVGGGTAWYGQAFGGAGGELRYKNNIAVISGQSYSVQVGFGGNWSANIIPSRSAFSTLCIANQWGFAGTGIGGSGWIGDGGGNGGNSYDAINGRGLSGAGAGGYSGNGANGVYAYSSGLNGAGGGGGSGKVNDGGKTTQYGAGGGVGIYWQGGNGIGGVGGYPLGTDGGGGSGGNYGRWGSSISVGPYIPGSGGACRIIWPWNSRTFPSNDVGP